MATVVKPWLKQLVFLFRVSGPVGPQGSAAYAWATRAQAAPRQPGAIGITDGANRPGCFTLTKHDTNKPTQPTIPYVRPMLQPHYVLEPTLVSNLRVSPPTHPFQCVCQRNATRSRQVRAKPLTYIYIYVRIRTT